MTRPVNCRVMLTFLAVSATLLMQQPAQAVQMKNCRPAAIVRQARRMAYFQKNLNTSLQCVAEGDPTLNYVWLKDGQELDLQSPHHRGRLALSSGTGSLTFAPALEDDQGLYQCRVHNPCGTSLSSKTQLLHAFIDSFPKIGQPTEVTGYLGKPLKLQCVPPASTPGATLTWLKELEEGDDYTFDYDDKGDDSLGRSVELGRRVTMDYSGNLYFVSLEAEDTQDGLTYVCMAANQVVRSFKQGEDKRITILGVTPSNERTSLMWHSPTQELVMEGGKAKFKCIFSGNPAPEVRWRRADGRQIDDKRLGPGEFDHEYHISEVHPDDAGDYVCSGMNALLLNPVEHTFTLSVESKPRWTKQPEDMEVGVEDNITVVCSVDSNPKPTVQWYINGIHVSRAPPAKNRHIHGNALVLSNVTLDDSQVVQCNASNVHGYLWADVFLQVEAMAPSIVSMPTQQKVAKEQTVTVPCQVEGKPRPQVLWYKGSQMLLGARYHVLPSGDLHIQSVDERDTGDYHCIAENRFGHARAQGTLIVRDKTEIVTPPTDDQVSQGETAIFTCGAVTAIEELIRLKYVWLKDGVPVDIMDPRVEVKEGTLQISHSTSQDSGNYTCTASNSLDSDQASAMLKVIAPPDPPRSLVMLSCSSSRAELEWEFDDSGSNFSPLEEFVLEFSTNHHPDVWHEGLKVPADKRQVTYTLSPWASYSFRVRARNHMGVSEPSEATTLRCQSAESRPHSNPQDVHTLEDRTGWLVIEWQPMRTLEHNAREFRYVVTWRSRGRAGEEGVIQSHVVWDWQQTQHAVQVGGVYRPYGITLQAVNALGVALQQPLEIIGHSGEAAPSVVPQNFELDPNENVTATTAAFRWDPVDTSPENINGNFRGYKVRYWKKGQKADTLHEEMVIVPEQPGRHRRAAGGKVLGRVAGLPSFSQVEAQVVVANTYFASQGSNVVAFTTTEGVPSRVKYLEALFRGSSHFLLEWGPPLETNGVLTGYQLGYQKVQGLMVGPVVIAREDLPVGQQRTTLDGLQANALYRVFIAAQTAHGPGTRYFIDVRTTDEASELAEPRIQAVVAGEKDVNVTFSLAQGHRGERTGSVYYLEYRRMGEHGWDREAAGARDRFWLTLGDLEPATTYQVRVVSVLQTAGHHSTDFRPSQETRFDTMGIVKETKRESKDQQGAKSGSFLSAAWFIGMMVAIALLLFILIIVCIAKRNRGKAYTFPPEKDTVDASAALFNDPYKNGKNGLKSGAPPGQEGEKGGLGEETDSLGEYGDDPSRFNEDGSFIGLYGPKAPPPDGPNPSHMSHIV